MPPKKSVTKDCPGCERALPVACKTCPCGHIFRKPSDYLGLPGESGLSTGLSAGLAAESSGSSTRRRTERVKREKPKFYDASQYQRAPRKRKPKANELTEPKRVRLDEKRSLKVKEREREREEAPAEEDMVYEDIMADATRQEVAKYSVVLSEINRKLGVVNPAF